MNPTILIVDDEKEIRELLRLYLEREGYTIEQAENGLSALARQSEVSIDLAIIDIMMPGLSGYRLIRQLRERSKMPIIIISAKTENHEKILGLDLGADDYVTKPFDPLEVTARVKAQLRRHYDGIAMADPLLKVGGMRLDLSAGLLHSGDTTVGLTATEFNLMKIFMHSPGQIFTKQQLYNGAWPEGFQPDDNAVMVAISKLRNKLPADSAEAIKTIRGLGYRLEVRP